QILCLLLALTMGGTGPFRLDAAPVSVFSEAQIRHLPESEIAVIVAARETGDDSESLPTRLRKTWSGVRPPKKSTGSEAAKISRATPTRPLTRPVREPRRVASASARVKPMKPTTVAGQAVPLATETANNTASRSILAASSSRDLASTTAMTVLPGREPVSSVPQVPVSDSDEMPVELKSDVASHAFVTPVVHAEPTHVEATVASAMPAAPLAPVPVAIASSPGAVSGTAPSQSQPAKAKDPFTAGGLTIDNGPIPENLGSVSYAIIEPEVVAEGASSAEVLPVPEINGTSSSQQKTATEAAVVPAIPAMVASATVNGPESHSLPPPLPPVESIEPERGLNISGSKTFEMKNAKVKGDVGHFSTENYESIPGFRLDQSLHLEIEGNISRHTSVNAVLDDKQDEDRRFTVFIDGSNWDLTLGDFPIALKNTEFLLHNKEVRGILAEGRVTSKIKSTFLFSQSKGRFRREQFRGAGQQQEFRLLGRPVVQNSERIFIDGVALQRGSQYLIDYEDGILKLAPSQLPIEVTSWIVVEYEVADSKLAFKRNLYGMRIEDEIRSDRRLALTWLREIDGSTPKSESNASGTVRPVDHQVIGLDGSWQIKPWLTANGELAFSLWDPNHLSELTAEDKEVRDKAGRLNLSGVKGPLVAELALRRIGQNFKQIGREEGATVLGERGLVNDILKQNGRLTYTLRPGLTLFTGLEDSRTNVSRDPTIPEVNFRSWTGGGTWKYRARSQFESRFESQRDEENRGTPYSNREKNVGTMVWDHDFGKIFTQTKLEHTAYEDAINVASDSRALVLQSTISGPQRKGFAWTAGVGHIRLDDELDPDKVRSDTQNYSVDLTFDPSRMFNARGIFQWRRENDYFTRIQQDDQVADSRIRYQPFRDLNTQFKYKVENTTKVVRDPSIDPTKYVNPPSLPVTKTDEEEVISRFENPVQKRTANFNAAYRFNQKAETNIDWKWRDLRDRTTKKQVSYNDRKAYELKFAPMAKIQMTGGYEDGVMRNLAPVSELRDTLKRFEMRNEFKAGYILTSRWEDHLEDDVLVETNDRRTEVRGAAFSRVFSARSTMELGLNRNIITSITPSREWEKKAAFIFTPSSRNQRYKFFVTQRSIEAAKPGDYLEGGVNFSQFIGTDTMLDGELKRVTSSATVNGNGYEATVANAKMVITF
ncbi:MAG TPA: hypothetical protein PKO06_05765, partial [Candidatus Ozemobacteraceae bacterium]|nr:hypothetical protein [Candidatus Ozemobacteraceae bacterium]